jgi:hypothetical protein
MADTRWEISLKEPVKLTLLPPLLSVDVVKLRGLVMNLEDATALDKVADVVKLEFLTIRPQQILTPTHPTWLEVGDAAVTLRDVIIPKGNIGMLTRLGS